MSEEKWILLLVFEQHTVYLYNMSVTYLHHLCYKMNLY